MPPHERQNEMIVQCFAALCFRLSKLVQQFGGEKLRKQFEDGVSARSAALGESLTVNEGQVLGNTEGMDWTRYRDLTEEIIGRARAIVGDKTVTAKIRETIRELETQSGENLYETSYRLGVLEYMNDT